MKSALLLLCFLGLTGILTLHGHTVGEDLFFHVLSPPEVHYLFQVRPAKDFGGIFTCPLQEVPLLPTEPPQACDSLTNGRLLAGSVALVERGGCSFVSKAKVVEHYGALAVVIADSTIRSLSEPDEQDSGFVDMVTDGTGRDTSIPAVFLSGKDGHMIRQALSRHTEPWAIISIPVNVTILPAYQLLQPPWNFW
uniref:protease-associated domain-containing protein 1 isoform X1 n=1 Tax=Myxine glutinosa TaxID=7769 RepID=UPI00358F511B